MAPPRKGQLPWQGVQLALPFWALSLLLVPLATVWLWNSGYLRETGLLNGMIREPPCRRREDPGIKDYIFRGDELQELSWEADSVQCQQRCALVAGCEYFSFQGHNCTVHGSNARVARRVHGVSGPPWCEGTRRAYLKLDEVDARLRDCYHSNASYQGGSEVLKCSKEVTPLECQVRCQFAKTCRFFVYSTGNSSCCLRDLNATLVNGSPGDVSGPQTCPDLPPKETVLEECPLDLGPLPKKVPVGGDSCAAAYPAYVSYLDRRFGNRTVLPAPADEVETMKKNQGTSALVFNITAFKTVELQVEAHVRSGGKPIEAVLEALGNRTVVLRWPGWSVCPSAGHKVCGVREVLNRTIERHGRLLLEDVRRLGGQVHLLFRGADADFPSNPRIGTEFHGSVPLHGYSSDPKHYDIAMPDFTFEKYPEIRSFSVKKEWTSEAWRDVVSRLRHVSHTKRGFIFRGKTNWRGTRRHLYSVTHEEVPAYARRSLRDMAPTGFDIEVSEYVPHTAFPTGFLSLYDQCKWLYTFHVPGTHYSAMLKYKLACGQTVFFFGDLEDEEFWYDALKDGENVVFLRPNSFWPDLHRAMQPNGPLRVGQRLTCVGKRAMRLVDTYLSQHGLDCYIMLYLTRYYLPWLLHDLAPRAKPA